MPALVKTLVDLGPLIVFYVSESYADIFVATGFLMLACAIAFTVSWTMTRKIALLPALTLAFALVFGGATLLFEDDSFIKIEVSLTNGLLGVFLVGGMLFKKSLLKLIFGNYAGLEEEGWNKITWRMGWFFISIAVLNEIVWRSILRNALTRSGSMPSFSAIASASGSTTSFCNKSRSARLIFCSAWAILAGIRMVREWSARALVIAWRIHQTA